MQPDPAFVPALRESETRLRLALSAAHMGIWDWNVLSGEVSWSEAVEALHGLPPGGFDGRIDTWIRLLHPQDRKRVIAGARQALTSRGDFGIEFRVRWPGGAVRWLSLHGHAFYDDSGRAVRMLGVAFDVSERRRLDEEKDAFLSSVSHDLKNPVASLLATTQLLQRRLQRGQPPSVDDLRDTTDTLVITASRIAEQLDQVLDIARTHLGRPLDLMLREVDLTTIVQQIVAEQGAALERHHIRIELPEAGEHSLVGQWDPGRLRRTLRNLIGNAIKYSPDGGEITVRLSRQDDYVCVDIADCGLGIPADDLPHVFERFHRGANIAGKIAGTGIGLADVRQIVEQHHGTVTIASTEGAGTTVSLRLPVAPPAS